VRAKALFTCNADGCPENGRVRDLTDKPWIVGPFCEECHRDDGTLEIIAGENRFTSTEAYVEFINSCAKELELLRRLETAGASNEEDQRKAKDLAMILEDAVCPCCHNKVPADRPRLHQRRS
jgi:hypothetical protein